MGFLFIIMFENLLKKNTFVKVAEPIKPNWMKTRLIIFALFTFALSACTQYTCPTYAKEDTKKVEVADKLEESRM